MGPRGGSSTANHAWAGIKQIRLIVPDDRDCRTGTIRIGARRTGSENHHLCTGESAEARQNRQQQAMHRA
jgi:hypothetical protein